MLRLLALVMFVLVACGPSDELIRLRYEQLPPGLQQVVDDIEPEFSVLSGKFAFPAVGVLELSGGLGYAL